MEIGIKEKPVENLRQVDFSEMVFPAVIVYDHPRDYPDSYVARVWEGARNLPTDIFIKRKTIREIREDAKAAGFSVKIPRQPEENPVIAESWIR